jgi:hypothetical protein
MHKLRHIHSKVDTETAFRIPVSVEDAIAEAVEAYDAMAAKVEQLQKDADRYRCIRASSKSQWRNGPGIYWYLPRWNRGPLKERLDNALDTQIRVDAEIRQQADALEGEGDE